MTDYKRGRQSFLLPQPVAITAWTSREVASGSPMASPANSPSTAAASGSCSSSSVRPGAGATAASTATAFTGAGGE